MVDVGTYELYALATHNASNWSSFDGTNGIERSSKRAGCAIATRSPPLTCRVWEPSDWVQCIEMAEHVPREHQASLVANLHYLNRKGVVISWALPGQLGHQHINGRTLRGARVHSGVARGGASARVHRRNAQRHGASVLTQITPAEYVRQLWAVPVLVGRSNILPRCAREGAQARVRRLHRSQGRWCGDA